MDKEFSNKSKRLKTVEEIKELAGTENVELNDGELNAVVGCACVDNMPTINPILEKAHKQSITGNIALQEVIQQAVELLEDKI